MSGEAIGDQVPSTQVKAAAPRHKPRLRERRYLMGSNEETWTAAGVGF